MKKLPVVLLIFGMLHSIAQKPIRIAISTDTNTITIEGIALYSFDKDSLFMLLGPPDRTEKTDTTNLIEEWPAEEGGKRWIQTVDITDYYYIYDNLGIVFYTTNSTYTTEKPDVLCIRFNNRREYNHDRYPDKIKEKFMPKHAFTGWFEINGVLLNPDDQVIKPGSDYATPEYTLFGTLFSPTSIAMDIDGLYAYNSLPYIRLYLESATSKRISYLHILGFH